MPPDTIKVLIAEVTVGDLDSLTEDKHPETGVQLTLWQKMQADEAAQHGGRLITHIGPLLSKAAQETNRALRSKNTKRGAVTAAAFTTAVFAVRAIKKHHDNGSNS